MACHIFKLDPANAAFCVIASVSALLQHVGKVSFIADASSSESRWLH
jgi:hypothetical protein